jgi:transcriptional regulator with XRE-family HTH domain
LTVSRLLCRLLGAKLRHAREARGLVLKDVEKASGISATHISEIERAKTAPTLQLLERLAKVLETPIDVLLELPPVDAHRVRPAGLRRILKTEDGTATLEYLCRSQFTPSYTLRRIRFAAEAVLRGGEPPTEDLIIVKRGRIGVTVDDEEFTLSSETGLHCLARNKIVISNAPPGEAVFLWASCSACDY